MTADDEILEAFLEESAESLDSLDRDLVELEQQPDSPDVIARVFRSVHTLKGTAGFLEFVRLQSLTHAAEDLLAALRSGALVADADVITSLLESLDVFRTILVNIRADGTEPAGSDSELIGRLRACLSDHVDVADSEGAVSAVVSEELSAGAGGRVVETSVDAWESVVPEDARSNPELVESTIRVDIAVLDKLSDLVGEITLARDQLAEAVASGGSGTTPAFNHLRHLTRELGDTVGSARLQPIGTVISRAPRIARSLAAGLDKAVRVKVTGEGLGVDRSIIQALRDPLTHLIRNAVDHGIETPEERASQHKNPWALLQVEASLEAGRVRIDVSDDGAGIDTAALLRKAEAMGLVDAAQGAAMSEAEKLDLIFHAGLTTAAEVTSTSGRGVGMDAVRSQLEAVGASIEVSSVMGQGTLVRLDVPLTLAVVPAVTVECAGWRYVVPQSDIHVVLRLESSDRAEIEEVAGARMLRWDTRLLPLLDLPDILGAAPTASDAATWVVVVAANGRWFGLIVDGVGDALETVVKSLPAPLESSDLFSGATILSDGVPALVLDALRLARSFGIQVHQDQDDADGEVETAPVSNELGLSVLLATGLDGQPVAIDMGEVHRLERQPIADVQHSGGLEMIRYEDSLLPLVRSAPGQLPDPLPVIVAETSFGRIGLVVRSLDDTTSTALAPSGPAERRGVRARLVAENLSEYEHIARTCLGRADGQLFLEPLPDPTPGPAPRGDNAAGAV